MTNVWLNESLKYEKTKCDASSVYSSSLLCKHYCVNICWASSEVSDPETIGQLLCHFQNSQMFLKDVNI